MRIARTSIVHFGSQIAATLIGFLATIYFARVLGAGALGTYFLVISVYLWLEILVASGVRTSVVKRLSEGEDRDRRLGAAAVVLATLVAIVVAGLFLLRPFVHQYVGRDVAHLIAVLVVVGSGYSILKAALRGEKKVHVAALLEPVDRTFRTGVQLALVLAGWAVIGLLVGYLVAMVLATVVGLYFLSTRLQVPRREDVESIVSFAKYAWLSGLSHRAFASMDTIVLGFFVTSSLIGIYEIAWNVASILAIFGASVSQAVFPEISDLSSTADENRGRISDLVNDALAFTGLFTIPGLVGGLVLGEWILAIYGPEFRRGTEVLVVLIVARLLAAYQGQFVNALDAIDRPDVAFRINGLFLVTNVGLNVGLVYLYGWIGAAVATAVSAALTLALGYLALRGEIRVDVPVREIGYQVFAAAVMGVVISGFAVVLDVTVPVAVLLVAIGALVYFLTLSAVSRRFRTVVSRNLPTEYVPE